MRVMSGKKTTLSTDHGHWIFPISVCIIPWWKTTYEMHLGKHIMQRHVKNWMDGTSLLKDFYELAAEQSNNVDWIPDSLVLPELHEDYSRSKPLPLNIVPITAKQFKKKLNDNHYKMVKVIANWERSGAGAGVVNNIDEDELDKEATQTQYDFLTEMIENHF